MPGRHRVAGLSLSLLAAAAGLGDWDDFDHQLTRAEVDENEPDRDTALWALDIATKLARRAGKRTRAARVGALSDRS